jgi:chromosome segregation ATPase
MSCNEQTCHDADKMIEKLNMYKVQAHEMHERLNEHKVHIDNLHKVSMQHHIRGQHELIRDCRRESDLKSEKIEKLEQYVTSLKGTIAIEKKHVRDLTIECEAQRESNRILRDTVAVLEERVQKLEQDARRDECNEERVERWVRQGLLSQWSEAREARESLEKQLAHWMEQVNALQRQVQTLERRVPSLRH